MEPDTSAEREKFLQDYPVAAKMVEQINETDPQKSLQALKEAFLKSGFTYSMAATAPEAFLKGRKDGDCSTLARAYVKIAHEYFGIENLEVCSKTKDFFVPGGGKVLDQNNATGNVDGGKHWVFTSHYWVDSPIGSIDLLFLGKAANESAWIDQTDEGGVDEIGYREFGKYRVYEAKYTGSSIADRYATDLAAAKEGQESSKADLEAMSKPGQKSSSGWGAFFNRLFD
ncbi:hypothetical protein [Acaryochloris thomasi]|nr:hypothetical protein [Acaryochloris thomasi]